MPNQQNTKVTDLDERNKNSVLILHNSKKSGLRGLNSVEKIIETKPENQHSSETTTIEEDLGVKSFIL